MGNNKTSSSGSMTTIADDVLQIVLPSIPVPTTTFSAVNGKQIVLFGSSGNDSMAGGNGADSLYGGDGDDILVGGKGDDTLIGASGNDYLYGGAGHDVFAYKAPDNSLDVICDWGSGDRIDIRPLVMNGGSYTISCVDTDGDHIADASLVTARTNGIDHDVVVIMGCTTITAADFVWS